MSFKTRWQHAYDHQAPPEALEGGIRQFNGYRHPRLYALLQASLNRATAHWKNRTILDAGCGTGDTNGFLAARNQVVGVDFSQQMVGYARRIYPRVGIADVEHLPFADGQFDAVIATGVWQCLPPETPFLSEIRRVLAPQGEAVLGWMLNADYLLYRRGVKFRLDPTVTLNTLTAQQIPPILAAAGLQVTALYATIFPLGTVNIWGKMGRGIVRPLAPAFTIHCRRVS